MRKKTLLEEILMQDYDDIFNDQIIENAVSKIKRIHEQNLENPIKSKRDIPIPYSPEGWEYVSNSKKSAKKNMTNDIIKKLLINKDIKDKLGNDKYMRKQMLDMLKRHDGGVLKKYFQ